MEIFPTYITYLSQTLFSKMLKYIQQSFLTFFLVGSSPYFYNAYALQKKKQNPLSKHSSKLQGVTMEN